MKAFGHLGTDEGLDEGLDDGQERKSSGGEKLLDGAGERKVVPKSNDYWACRAVGFLRGGKRMDKDIRKQTTEGDCVGRTGEDESRSEEGAEAITCIYQT